MEDDRGDDSLLRPTLEQFETINRLFSGSRRLIRRFVLRGMQPGREYRFLDIGCGAGDIARWLVRVSARRGLNVRVIAMDIDERVVKVAQDLSLGMPGLTIQQGDVRDIGLKVDFVFCNHLLHHFEDKDIPQVIRSLEGAATVRVIVNDVRRSRVAYVLFGIFATLFLRGSHHKHDGQLSIRKGLKTVELKRLLNGSGRATRYLVRGRPIARLQMIADMAG